MRAGRCRERRYADHIFIQIYFIMHHFVVKFSKFSSPKGIDPPNQNLRTFLLLLVAGRASKTASRVYGLL